MVSTDHFRHELLAQLGRAAKNGRIDVLINSGELCRSISNGNSSSVDCCDAMQVSSSWAIRCFSTEPTVQE